MKIIIKALLKFCSVQQAKVLLESWADRKLQKTRKSTSRKKKLLIDFMIRNYAFSKCNRQFNLISHGHTEHFCVNWVCKHWWKFLLIYFKQCDQRAKKKKGF